MHRVQQEIVRCEHASPGDMSRYHRDWGRVPDGGGKRFAPGFAEIRSGPRSKRSPGIDYKHAAIDDHSRCAYMEAFPDEKGDHNRLPQTGARLSR
ncbi:MAG: hypothetical protein IH960_01100 [Chloroflexi bacterium]|nr:hypothetical protein [Chloroflexota bacterium]